MLSFKMLVCSSTVLNKEALMHASRNKAKNGHQPRKANNRAARKRRERARQGAGYDRPQRGLSSTAGSKGARRRKRGG